MPQRASGASIGRPTAILEEWMCQWSASSMARAENSIRRKCSKAGTFSTASLERRLLGFLPLGTGVLGRRRQDLGDQLDHEVYPSGVTGSHQPLPACLLLAGSH